MFVKNRTELLVHWFCSCRRINEDCKQRLTLWTTSIQYHPPALAIAEAEQAGQDIQILCGRVRHCKGEDTDALPQDLDDALPNVAMWARVYVYCERNAAAAVGMDALLKYDPSVHAKPVYVVIYKEVRCRDKHHRCNTVGTFARRNVRESQYIIVVLKERRFPAAAHDFKQETLHPAATWVNDWEARYITEFDTLGSMGQGADTVVGGGNTGGSSRSNA